MSQKTFNIITGSVFLVIAVLHALRMMYGWNAVIGSLVIPLWVSGVAIIIAGYLAYTGLTLK